MKYYIEEADLESDKKEIITFLNKQIEDLNFNEKYYAWRYEDNPAGKARCWLAKNEEKDNIIGISSVFPRKFYFNSKPLIVYNAGDFHFTRDYRCFSPAFKTQKTLIKEIKKTNTKLIYGLPSNLAYDVLDRVGYKKLGDFKQYIKPINLSYMSDDYLPSLLKFLPIRNIIDVINKPFSKEYGYKNEDEIFVETPKFFNFKFDSYWEKIKSTYKIIGERSSSFLNWRYIDNPNKIYKIFCIKNINDDVLGYIVYFMIKNIYYIVDIMFPSDNEVINSLLSKFF
jgi:hypothetical protein